MAERKPKPRYWRLIEIGAIVFAVLLGLWLRAHVFQTGYIPSESMEPTLRSGDRVIIDKVAYRRRLPQRGEIVAFTRPGEPDLFVKRVIGLPGETVLIFNGEVRIDGQLLDEPYLKEPPQREVPLAFSVPDGKLVVLGDNRNRSEDSRDYGPIPADSVVGRVTRVIWPLGRMRRLH